MRASLFLLAVLAACSDASAPHHGLVLTTELSSTFATPGQVVAATLRVSNTADTTVLLSFSLPAVFVEVDTNGQWLGDALSNTGTNVLDVYPGTNMPLGTVSVAFYTPPGPLNAGPVGSVGNGEEFVLSPGSYPVRACYFPFWPSTPEGYTAQVVCGNSVLFTFKQ